MKKEESKEFLLKEIEDLRQEILDIKEENRRNLERGSHFEDIVYNMRDTVEREDASYTISYVNKAYCEYYGIHEKDIIGRNSMNCVLEADHKKINNMMKRVTPKNPDYRYSCRVRNKEGDIVWVETEGRAFFDQEGNVIEFQEVGRDISQHQSAVEMAAKFQLQMEEKVRERTLELTSANQALAAVNGYLQTMLNNISEAIITIDDVGNIEFLNCNTNTIWRNNERYIREQLCKDMETDGSLLSTLFYNKSCFQNREITFLTPHNNIQCIATGIYLEKNEGTVKVMLILQLLSDVRHLVNTISGAHARFFFTNIIGSSRILRDTIAFAERIATGEGNIIIEGESGTGKELFAQSIHNASPRKKGPFIAVNCGAIPRDLIGSELFGYAEGSFTGAKRGGKPGKFELASGGTIFLDEIGEMPLEQQIILLRVLQERTIMRIGGESIIPIDVRVICATNKNLLNEVEKGNFRRDLFYRLNVINLSIPPLRERKDDISELLKHFVNQLDKDNLYCDIAFPKELVMVLKSYDWPGNVRELQNITERMYYIANGQPFTPGQLPMNLRSENYSQNTVITTEKPEYNLIQYQKQQLEEMEKEQILNVIHQYKYNMSKVAAVLGISRTTLYRKLDKYGIKR